MGKAKARVRITIDVEVNVATQPDMTLDQIDQKFRSQAITKVWAGLRSSIWASGKAHIVWRKI